MYASAYDFKAFYNTTGGRIVRRVLKERIREIWPETAGQRVLGCGYAAPYLRMFEEQGAERVCALMPAARGVHHWPPGKAGLVCLSKGDELPIETESVDRVLLIHDLEYVRNLRPALGEIWRVLKSSGRLLVIVPNRTGLWARCEWSPFGHGAPFSVSQLCHYLRESHFAHERTEHALFVPPCRFPGVLRVAGLWEWSGRRVCPALSGVHMVEAVKQIYGGTPVLADGKTRLRRGVLVPVPTG